MAAVLLLLALILFTPFGLSVDYAGGALRAAARVFCAEVQVYPRREKPGGRAGKEKKPGAGKKPKDEKPKKEKPPLITREMLPELLRLLGRTLTRFRRKITVNRFVLHITVAGEADPFNAVMTYGAVNCALAAAGSAAGGAFRVKKSDVQTGMDFSAGRSTVEGGITLTISIARILAVAAAAGFGFLKIKRRADRAAKAAAKERKDTNGTDADPDGRVSQAEHSQD